MECLHGKPASSSKTENGLFFYCGQKPSCNFFCPQNDCSYFENAIAMWRNSNSSQPRCHDHKKLAKMRVVKDISKPSFGRPFFICSDKEKTMFILAMGRRDQTPMLIMVSNARREKLKKRESIMAGCSTFVRKVKRSRVVTSNGEIRREMKILLIQFAR